MKNTKLVLQIVGTATVAVVGIVGLAKTITKAIKADSSVDAEDLIDDEIVEDMMEDTGEETEA